MIMDEEEESQESDEESDKEDEDEDEDGEGGDAYFSEVRTTRGVSSLSSLLASLPRASSRRAGGPFLWSDEKWRQLKKVLRSPRMQDESWDLCAELNAGAVPPPSPREALLDVVRVLGSHLVATVPKVQRLAHVGSSAKLTDIGLRTDVDTIAYIERRASGDLPSQEEMDEVLAEIQASLRRLKIATEVRDFYTGEGEAVLDSEQKQTYVTGEYKGISFDVLLGSEPRSEAELAQLFSSNDTLRRTKFFLKTSLAERNTAWVLGMPWQVRRAIRLLKWLIYSVCDWSSKGGGAPRGILLELIAIDVWRKLGRPAACSVIQVFKRSLRDITDREGLRIEWTIADVRTLPSQPNPAWRPPIVCDPHNPVRNVALSMGGDNTTRKKRWDSLHQYARTALDGMAAAGI